MTGRYAWPRPLQAALVLSALTAAAVFLLLGVAIGYFLHPDDLSWRPALVEAGLYTSTWPLLDDGSPFINYTIIPPWDARWPLSSVSDLHGLVLSFVGSHNVSLQLDDLVRYYPALERNLLQPYRSHCDYVVLYLRWPVDVEEAVFAALRDELHWQQLEPNSSRLSLYARAEARAARSGVRLPADTRGTEFVTPAGLRVLLYPLVHNLPQWLVNGDVDALRLQRPGWHSCYERRWWVDYELYSGAVWNWPILSHPLLAAYDAFIKMDLDIEWKRRAPVSPFRLMQQRNCVWLHSMFRRREEDCNAEAAASALHWAAARRHVPASNSSRFFHLTNGYFFSNMAGAWLGYLRSPHVLSLMRHLWESPLHRGYFQHRWTDQPAWSLALGMFYQLTDDEVENVNGSKNRTQYICDLSKWRGRYFIHH